MIPSDHTLVVREKGQCFRRAYVGFLILSKAQPGGPWKYGLVTEIDDEGHATRWKPFDYKDDRYVLHTPGKYVTPAEQVNLKAFAEAVRGRGQNRFSTVDEARSFGRCYRVGRQLSIFDPEL